MFEKLLPYIRLGIDFLNGLLDFAMQLLGLLTTAEETIAGSQAAAF
jgi:hypothetical protein